jgi:hypothetical protein
MVVKAENLEAALEVLNAAGFEAHIDTDHILVTATPDDGARISRALATKRMYVSELRPMEVSLEDVFLELTKEEGA